MRRHPCWLVGAGGLSWIRPRSAAASRCGIRKVVVSCRMQLNRKTDEGTQKSRCRAASDWNSYSSLQSCPCSFGCLFCRTEGSAIAFFQPGASATAAASSVTPPFRQTGRNNCNLYNIISKCPECKLKWRKSPDLFASKMEWHSVRRPVSNGNAGTGRAGTPETRLCHLHRGMKQGTLEQHADIQFDGTRRRISAVQSKQVISPDPQTRRFRDFEQKDLLFRLFRRGVSDERKTVFLGLFQK